jgi:ABC-2 type transport system permease protein
MTHVLRAQARIVATTKIAFAGLLAMAAFVMLTGLPPAVLFGQHRDPHTVLEGAATIAAVTAMLLGALQTAGDLQNGMTRALLLAEPRRLRVLGAQLLVSLGLGASVGAAAALLADSTQAVLGRPGRPAATIAWIGLGTAVAASLCGLLGAAAGVVLRNPALAACVIVLWSYALEPFISTLSYSVYIYLPGGARESLVRHVSAHHHIPPPLAGGLILAGWASAAALAAALTFTRRDLA